MPTEAASTLLEKLFARQGLKRGMRDAQVVQAWRRAVGPEAARLSEARRFTRGTLFVDVSDSETAMHLAMQRRRFMDAINDALGWEAVKELRFAARGSVSPVATPDRSAEPRFGPPGPDDTRAAVRLVGEADQTVGLEAVTRAAAAFAAREREAQAAGWSRCVYCDAVIEGGRTCLTCGRYEHDARVQQTAAAWTAGEDGPTMALTEDEARVARTLAAGQLLQQVEMDLPAALTDRRVAAAVMRALQRRAALLLNVASADVSDTMLRSSLSDRLRAVLDRLPVDASDDV